ncbi:MAG TPA: hypothetical protein DIV79_13205 [Opitutae bacterium]|nr:hypothetical protein [Opitutae bacterium]
MKGEENRKILCWPLWTLWGLGVAGIFLGYLLGGDVSRQQGVMRNMAIAIACLTLSLFWLLLFSRLAWRKRLLFLGILGSTALISVSLFRFEGVSGDLVPIIKWRWASVERAEVGDIGVKGASVDGAYPQFLGPNRNATVTGIDLSLDWSVDKPKLLWRQPIGEAWSGFATSGFRAITQEQDGEDELITCYHLLTGERLWESRMAARYDNPLGGVGPRATPTIDGDRVYAVGATGALSCLDLQTGERLWGFNILEKHGAKLPDWGVAGSPLVYEDLVVLSPGGRDGNSLVAYDKSSGSVVWSGGSDRAHWSSPVLHEIEGEKQVLIFNGSGVAAHRLDDGSVEWEYPWKRSTGTPRVAIPVKTPGNRFVVSSGYGAGADLFQVSKTSGGFSATQQWRSLHLKSKFNNFVYKDGYLYGLDDGVMACIDGETGRRTWKKGRYGHGQLILGDDWLLLMAENGEVVLFEPNPEAPIELGRFEALEGKTWNPPALAGSYLLLRNHLQAACFKLPILPEQGE